MTRQSTSSRNVQAQANDKKRRVFSLAPALLMACLLVLAILSLIVGCGGSLSGPEAAVQKFLTASENKDIDAVLELMHPQALSELQEMITADGQTFDDAKPLLAASLFSYDSVKFSDIEFETTEISEDEAIVTIVGGSLTEASEGVTETHDVQDSDEPVEFYLYREDGRWYMDFDSIYGGSASGPEAAVQKFLTASENKDIDAVLELMHPQALSELQEMITADGQTFDDVKPLLTATFFPYDSIEFSDIEFETTEIGDDEAIVTIVGGSLAETYEGVTETYDVQDSDAPVEFYLYYVDGYWYIDFDSL